MKIFTASQLYEADRFTIQKQGISSGELMERAALAIFNWMHERMQGAPVKISLFCGVGNNGGDGLALARHLWEHGYNIEVHVVSYSEKRSEDFLDNLNLLQERKIWPNFIQEDSEFPQIDPDGIIVDAIFGIGLSRPPEGWLAELIAYLNNSEAYIVSIDIPSGLYVDKAVDRLEAVIRANYVLSIQAPKLSFFLPQTAVFCEQWTVLDIGMDEEILNKTDTEYYLLNMEDIRQWYQPRERFSHKGTYGHTLIVGGSYGKIGAVMLSARASLVAGSGLVSTCVPRCGYIPIQAGLPEVMVMTDTSDDFLAEIKFDMEPSAIGIGMGMGTRNESRDALSALLDVYDGPLVIDADALNILSQNNELLEKLPPGAVLTPHPGELKRLLGDWKDDFDKLDKAKDFSKRYNCILVLKDAITIVISSEGGLVSNTGNPGMATAGSGDVLAGMITSLLAQKYEPMTAAATGVYLHGRAGDLAAAEWSEESLTAGKITDFLGKAFLELSGNTITEPKPEEENGE